MAGSGSQISRRGLIVGLGAAGGVATLAGAPPAAARAGSPSGRVQFDAPPGGLAPISSAPEAGIAYQFRAWLDFTPEDSLLYGRAFGGSGVYTSGADDFLAASFDLPPGATLYDLEWYVSNSVPMSVYANAWQSSAAVLDTFWSASIPAASGITATRFVIPSNVNGPYPHGTRLLVACASASDRSQQLNGVRAGFKNAPRTPVLLTTPVRAYDSKASGGPLPAGATRTIPLSSVIPAGAAGAILNVTVVNTVGRGSLKVYAAGTPAPTPSSINWSSSNLILSNQVTTAVSLNRSITVAAVGNSTNFLIDVLSYLI